MNAISLFEALVTSANSKLELEVIVKSIPFPVPVFTQSFKNCANAVFPPVNIFLLV